MSNPLAAEGSAIDAKFILGSDNLETQHSFWDIDPAEEKYNELTVIGEVISDLALKFSECNLL